MGTHNNHVDVKRGYIIGGFIIAIVSVVIIGSLRLVQQQTETDRLAGIISPLKILTNASSKVYYLPHIKSYDLQNELQFLLVPTQLIKVSSIEDIPGGAYLLTSDTVKTAMANAIWQDNAIDDQHTVHWFCLIKKEQR